MSNETPPKPQSIKMTRKSDESDDRVTARHCAAPEIRAGVTLLNVGTGINDLTLDISDTIAELQSLSAAAVKGDLSRAEATLATQANALDALFHALARRSIGNMGQGDHRYLDAADRYMRLALRAQGQCRATLETLAAIKNPTPVAFVKQANFAHGPQQVNNGGSPPSRERENEINPNKLLEATNGERLDTGATSAAGRANQDLEAVGVVNRPAKPGRKVAS